MHKAVLDYVSRWATEEPIGVLDIGGRDINGTPRHLFPRATYLSIDCQPGRGVDLVQDGVTWRAYPGRFDLVLCLEVFEHTDEWPALIGTATYSVRPGGRLIVTCAGPGRARHSAFDGGPDLRPGEWYRNIDPEQLLNVLQGAGWVVEECAQVGEDVQATAAWPL